MSDIVLEVIEEANISLEIQEEEPPVVSMINVGADGAQGLSAYQVAVQQGFVGDEDAWLASLQGGFPAGGTGGQILAKIDGTDYNAEWIDAPVATGNANSIASFDANGILQSTPGYNINSNGGLDYFTTIEPNNDSGYFTINQSNANINPLQNSDDDTYAIQGIYVNIDTDLDGFSLGRNGQALQLNNWSLNHDGHSDIGGIAFLNQYADIGNGTDPITVKGIGYVFAFGNINAEVTIDGPIQGYIFQPSIDEDASLESYTVAFADFANFATPGDGHTSFAASPQLAGVNNNSNYSAFNINPNITEFFGNSGFTGMGVFPNIGKINTGNFQGITVSPNIADAGNQYCVGLNVSMAGVSGTNVKAAHFEGDVSVDGDFSFTGSLTLGALNAYGTMPLVDTAGSPSSIHLLITAPTVADNETLTSADFIGVNTAMLLQIGDNATVETSFIGLAALGLPAVITMGVGSTVDRVAGAMFAVSLDPGGTGGVIEEMNLCRSVAIPNGVTQIDNLRGYLFDLPFGDPGVDTWGFYEQPGKHNFFAGDLKIGSGGDIVGAGYKLDVQGGGFLLEDAIELLNAIGSSIGFFGTSPAVQQASSGAVAAGGTYGATEQTMIQEMYNALRAYGLLT